MDRDHQIGPPGFGKDRAIRAVRLDVSRNDLAATPDVNIALDGQGNDQWDRHMAERDLGEGSLPQQLKARCDWDRWPDGAIA
jgi:hypothetical protein